MSNREQVGGPLADLDYFPGDTPICAHAWVISMRRTCAKVMHNGIPMDRGIEYEWAGLQGETLMGKSTCDFCAAAISQSEFDKGHAVVLLKKTYCKKCLERAVRQKTKNPNRKSGRHTPEMTH